MLSIIRVKVQYRSVRAILLNMLFRSSTYLFIVYLSCTESGNLLLLVCFLFSLHLLWFCLIKLASTLFSALMLRDVWSFLWILKQYLYGPWLSLMNFGLNSIYLRHQNLKTCFLIIYIFLVYFCSFRLNLWIALFYMCPLNTA